MNEEQENYGIRMKIYFKLIKNKINKNINNDNELNELIEELINTYNITAQIIIHHLISSIFIRGITINTIIYIEKIIDLIIDKLSINSSNSCSVILLSSTIFFIVEQTYIYNVNNMNIINMIIDKINNSTLNSVMKQNLLSCISPHDSNTVSELSEESYDYESVSDE